MIIEEADSLKLTGTLESENPVSESTSIQIVSQSSQKSNISDGKKSKNDTIDSDYLSAVERGDMETAQQFNEVMDNAHTEPEESGQKNNTHGVRCSKTGQSHGIFSNKSIDHYTRIQYNSYGWVAVNNVLTVNELNDLSDDESSFYINEVIDCGGQFDSFGYLEDVARKRIFKEYTYADFEDYGTRNKSGKGHSSISSSNTYENRRRSNGTQKRDGSERRDRDYINAVERGDTETAQRMVDEGRFLYCYRPFFMLKYNKRRDAYGETIIGEKGKEG